MARNRVRTDHAPRTDAGQDESSPRVYDARLRVGGSYLVVDGLLFKDGGVTGGHVIAFRGENDKGADHCRVTNCAVIDYNVPLPKEDATAYYCSL
jgi:hypothetical protein